MWQSSAQPPTLPPWSRLPEPTQSPALSSLYHYLLYSTANDAHPTYKVLHLEIVFDITAHIFFLLNALLLCRTSLNRFMSLIIPQTSSPYWHKLTNSKISTCFAVFLVSFPSPHQTAAEWRRAGAAESGESDMSCICSCNSIWLMSKEKARHCLSTHY